MQASVDMSMACLRSDVPKSAIASSQAGPNVDRHCGWCRTSPLLNITRSSLSSLNTSTTNLTNRTSTARLRSSQWNRLKQSTYQTTVNSLHRGLLTCRLALNLKLSAHRIDIRFKCRSIVMQKMQKWWQDDSMHPCTASVLILNASMNPHSWITSHMKLLTLTLELSWLNEIKWNKSAMILSAFENRLRAGLV